MNKNRDKKIRLKSSPPEDPILSKLDIIDEHTEQRIAEIAALCGVEPEDPVYVLLAKSIADREDIEGSRQDLARLCHTIEVDLTSLHTQTATKIQTIQDLATKIKTEANRLSRQLTRQRPASSVVTFLWAFFGSVTGSVIVIALQHLLANR